MAQDMKDLAEALDDVFGWYQLGGVAKYMAELGETAAYHRTLNQARAELAIWRASQGETDK